MITVKTSDLSRALEICTDAIKNGGFVVAPTDTLYGILADATDENAVAKVVGAKGRENKPISVIVSDFRMMEKYAEVPAGAMEKMRKMLPGPFTIVFRPKFKFPQSLFVSDSVGIRIPKHSFVLEVCRRAGVPLTATSANISGQPAASSLREVPESIRNAAAFCVDGGTCEHSAPSTVVDMRGEPKIIRQGAGKFEM
ncbi:MAG: L-threonylcarbamoyladenylate synthase [Candidatus Micrarchaeota archaeon]|nr:L-threonylcarbamoyladenylate synthase [Candidatus Micrarchaeota archaeon]